MTRSEGTDEDRRDYHHERAGGGTRERAAAHDHDYRDRSRRALALALLINTGFFVIELAGALYAGSLTLLADATHMLTDSASLGLALFAAWVASRPADARRTYGYQRAEVLGALANAVFLLGIVAYILADAYERFRNPRPIDAPVVVGVGILGLLANLAAARILAEERGSLNVRGAYLHLLVDAAGSVAAIVVGTALVITDLYVLDPLFAVVIAALVLYSTWDLLADALNILLQGTPPGIDIETITASLEGIDGVSDAHDVHVWALSSAEYTLSAHLVTADFADPDLVLERSRHMLGEAFDIGHATIQIESGGYTHTHDLDCYGPGDTNVDRSHR